MTSGERRAAAYEAGVKAEQLRLGLIRGSVRYVPTAEQATDPILSACFAAGMTERETIDELHRALVALERST